MKKASYNIDTIFNYLLDYEYFTYEELLLCINGWGDNEKTYNTICRVRYAMDVDQLALEDEVYIDELYTQYLERA